METISNVVNTASKAIWGEQPAAGNETTGTEPVSGVQGKGTATEPYDQGNAADPTDPTVSNETAGKEPVSGLQGKGTATDPFDQGNSADATTTTGKDDLAGTTSLPIREKSSEPSSKPTIPTDSFNSAAAANASTAAHTSDITSTTSATDSDVKPLGTTVTPTHQGADKPHGEAEDLLKKHDPTSPSSEPLSSKEAEKTAPTTQEERRESNLGQPGGQAHGALPKGTGEQWTKTSGVAADGGDFDATKPGAGKEADRLLEEKGIHKDAKGAADQPDAAGAATGEKEKVSKMGKLKEKLHIGHKH